MNQELANFIRAKIDLIGKKDFIELYRTMNRSLSPKDVGSITEFFLDLDINPLFYMENVPEDFAYESGIKSIIIPDNINKIGNEAFASCAELERVVIGNNATNIGAWAFRNCNKLTRVDIPGSVEDIGYSAFGNCERLNSVNIGSGVMSIGDWAFSCCEELTNITIPASITYMCVGVFLGCAKLTTINYLGTKSEWNSICEREEGWDSHTGDYIIHCTDGDILKGEQ